MLAPDVASVRLPGIDDLMSLVASHFGPMCSHQY